MKKFLKSFLAITTALMCAVTMLTPVNFQAAVSTPKTQTVYLGGKDVYTTSRIAITGLKKSSKITKVKSSKKTIAQVTAVMTNGYEYSPLEGNYGFKNYSADIYVVPLKKGTAKIT